MNKDIEQEIFDYMSQEFGVTVMQSQIYDIAQIVCSQGQEPVAYMLQLRS